VIVGVEFVINENPRLEHTHTHTHTHSSMFDFLLTLELGHLRYKARLQFFKGFERNRGDIIPYQVKKQMTVMIFDHQ
jgi:hypothetical protein